MEQQMGWVHGSNMTRIYVHLSGKDQDEAILKANGIEVRKEIEEKPQPKPCPRCEAVNAVRSRFCRRCGLPLDAKTALEVQEATREKDDKLAALLENPEVQEFLAMALARQGQIESAGT